MRKTDWKRPISITISKEAERAIREIQRAKNIRNRSQVIEWLVLSYVAQTPEVTKQ